jgi:flavin reductase (DIM6/NTAB) family NADH-FMN oxidoreductase RutF
MKQSLGAKTLAIPTPVWLVGTYDKAGKANIMAAAWGGICCSRPPCIQVSLRAATYTHGNIKERGSLTVNIPSKSQWREADYAGIVSGRNTNKIRDIGWTTAKSTLIDAPIIEECKVTIECRLKETIELGLHTMFVGEIMDVKAEEDTLVDGKLSINKVKPIIFSTGDDGYFSVGEKVADAFKQRTPP